MTWEDRQREHLLKASLEAVLLLTAERVVDMREGCKAKRYALESMRVVNEWIAARRWPYGGGDA